LECASALADGVAVGGGVAAGAVVGVVVAVVAVVVVVVAVVVADAGEVVLAFDVAEFVAAVAGTVVATMMASGSRVRHNDAGAAAFGIGVVLEAVAG